MRKLLRLISMGLLCFAGASGWLWCLQLDGPKVLYLDARRSGLERGREVPVWLLRPEQAPSDVGGPSLCTLIVDGNLIVRKYDIRQHIVPFDMLLYPYPRLGDDVLAIPLAATSILAT